MKISNFKTTDWAHILGIGSLVGIFALMLFSPCFAMTDLGVLLNNLFLGIFASYIFFIIVVLIPEKNKHDIIKRNFREHFTSFKAEIIRVLLSQLELEDTNTEIDLTDIGNFRDFFNAHVSKTQTRWDRIMDGLEDDTYSRNEIMIQFEIMREECQFVLNNLDIQDPRVFGFFKRFSQATYRFKNYDFETSDIKPLASLLWEIFAGWSWTSGYPESDVFEEIFNEL